jgi:hypothetical protein
VRLARAVTWSVTAATDLKQDVVSETFMAYLMGPAVMLMVGVVLWLAPSTTRTHAKEDQADNLVPITST